METFAVSIFLFLAIIILCPIRVHAQAEEVPDTISSELDEEYIDEEDTDTINYFLSNAVGEQPRPPDVRNLPDSVINVLRNNKAFWYANENWKKPEPKTVATGPRSPLIYKPWFRNLLWIIIICCFVVAVIWYLSESHTGIFRRKQVSIVNDEDGIAAGNIFEINYSGEINNAVNAGNYRLAVRLMYLQLLKNLAERNIIQYTQDRTNFEYLLQLHQSAYYRDFFRLTRNYEYSWYGLFDINNEAFNSIRKEFESFNRKLN